MLFSKFDLKRGNEFIIVGERMLGDTAILRPSRAGRKWSSGIIEGRMMFSVGM
jgi:hypothetical protein